MSNSIRLEVPYVFQGTAAPRCHVACLRMILEYYGVRYTTSYLMNLSGYNYGFTYFKEAKMAFAGPATPLGPWQILSYAAQKVGCQTKFYKDKPWEEAWRIMKEYLSQGKPVYVARLDMQHLWKTTRPVPHVIVLCGYDEDRDVVIIHDPALGQTGEGIQYLSPNKLPDGTSGCYAEFPISEFRRACAVEEIQWAFSGKNGFCIINPANKQLAISWLDVIKRNANLILGNVEEEIGEPIPGHHRYGPDGLEEFARDLESGFGLFGEPPRLFAALGALRGLLFRSGSSYMFDASAFVSGLAALTADQELKEASNHLGLIGVCYDECLGEAEYILEHQSISPKSLEERLTRISSVLKRTADQARIAGKNLMEGAKALT